jgi:transposase
MLRHRLTDEQWERIKDFFDPPADTGRPQRNRREVMDGILWILRTGSPWRDLPRAFGPWQTVWRLFDRWNHDGTLDAILQELQGEIRINEELWCIDGTAVRAARCAAGGGKKTIPKNRRTTPSAGVAVA